MKIRTKIISAFFIATAMLTNSCDLLEGDSEGPNELGGNADIELTKVGNKTVVSFGDLSFDPAFESLEGEATVIENRNGIVTYRVNLKFDEKAAAAMDSLLGTQDLTDDAKKLILDAMLNRFNASLDTSDKENMTITADLKSKVTDEGFQEYFTSKGDETKPFTVVKYNASIGDEYTFTVDGRTIKRQVLYRSSEDDYQVGFWLLKVIKVKEEDPANPIIQDLWYVTNHKYGLVGIEAKLMDGRDLELVLFPPTL